MGSAQRSPSQVRAAEYPGRDESEFPPGQVLAVFRFASTAC
jgi:hypothetical protein